MEEVENLLLKTAKIGAGILAGVIAAELVAIGGHAAISDAEFIYNDMKEKMAPPPPQKKKLFGRKDKGVKK